MRFLQILLCLLLFLFSESSAEAQPKVCVGYNKETKQFGKMRYFADGSYSSHWNCAEGQAYYTVGDPFGPKYGAVGIPVHGICCDLPYSDILTNITETVRGSCPEGHVATGAFTKPGCYRFLRFFWRCPDDSGEYMRCAKINLERYQLGPARPGRFWGVGGTWYSESNRLRRDELPAAVRYAAGRMSQWNWDLDGCIGQPPGSLLVAKTTKNCDGFLFRELQFRGKEGDPAPGTPVSMFPDCRRISDRFDPNAQCLPE